MSAVVLIDVVSKTKTEIVHILKMLAIQMVWSSGKSLIASTGLSTSRGRQETISNLLAEVTFSEHHLLKAHETLSNAARWHTYVGNKRVTFFDISAKNLEAQSRLKTWNLSKSLDDLNAVLKERPFDILTVPTQQNDLEKYKVTPPQLLSASLVNGKLYLQYFRTRAYWRKDTLKVSGMPEEQAKYFHEHQEVIGVKTKLVSCFDTVVVDTNSDLIDLESTLLLD